MNDEPIPTDEPTPSPPPPERRRGRPAGSVSLTPEIQQRLLELIRGGTYDYIAAEAVGISERTFREWIQRGDGEHPTRPPTRKLKAFAREVRRAKAEVRAAAEIRVFRDNASRWLSYQARTKPGREGWTHPPETQMVAEGAAQLEALIRELEDEDTTVLPSFDESTPYGPDGSPEGPEDLS
jgi:hypothetical protein